jgi:hypothetical protein
MRDMPDENAEPCGCRWLEREASEPESYVKFDAVLNEYHILRRDGGYCLIYHCPFCGGAAPKSKRALMFASISDEEEQRLIELTGGLRTIHQVLETLGEPDLDSHASSSSLEDESSPPVVEFYRQLRYQRLSDTASVVITELKDGRISVRLQGKYIGPPGVQ